MARRSELVALRAEDLSLSPHGSFQILIRRSKNDPYGNGRLGFISPSTHHLLIDWLQSANIKGGFIFRGLQGQTLRSDPLHDYSVCRILKRCAEDAGLPAEIVRKLSGHSMRVGSAQDLMAAGHGILPIMSAGGWKSINVVARYVEHVSSSKIFEKQNQ